MRRRPAASAGVAEQSQQAARGSLPVSLRGSAAAPQRARQKGRIDGEAQGGQQFRLAALRRHHERGQPAHAGAIGIELEHHAILYAGQGQQAPGQVAQGGALAGDFQQVGIAPAQAEAALRQQFDQILQRHRRRKVGASTSVPSGCGRNCTPS